jgi:16S rRNA (adenine1518-N6/adenine1519-N6)-dimethyltransferase
MVQEEVGERMGAAVGTKAYSAFTVMIRSRCTVTRRMRIQPGSFYPRPEVSSALVELSPREDAPEIHDTQRLTTVTRAVFHARRKTVLNSIEQSAAPLGPGGRSLTREEVRNLLSEADIDPSVRGETLEVERITHLANETARLFGSRSEGARPE